MRRGLNMVGANVKFYLPFAKINQDEQTVEGWASVSAVDGQPVLDLQDEIVTLDCIKDALPGYLPWSNLREMHQPSAVGVAKEAQIREGGDAEKEGLWIKGHIVDADAWLKVKTGVYKGFSIGGEKLQKVGNQIRKLRLYEISLVDRPANPQCTIDVYKALGSPGAKAVAADAGSEPERLTDIDREDVHFMARLITKLTGRSKVNKAATDPDLPNIYGTDGFMRPDNPGRQDGDQQQPNATPNGGGLSGAEQDHAIMSMTNGGTGIIRMAGKYHAFKDGKMIGSKDTEEEARKLLPSTPGDGSGAGETTGEISPTSVSAEGNNPGALEQAAPKGDLAKDDDGKGGHLVTEPDGTKHLPTTRNGKPDHGLMGAAHAALCSPNGFRGNKYGGPDKGKAKARLKAMYEREGMEWPGDGDGDKAATNGDLFKDLGWSFGQLANAFDGLRQAQRQWLVEAKVEKDPPDTALGDRAGALASELADLMADKLKEEGKEAENLTDINDQFYGLGPDDAKTAGGVPMAAAATNTNVEKRFSGAHRGMISKAAHHIGKAIETHGHAMECCAKALHAASKAMSVHNAFGKALAAKADGEEMKYPSEEVGKHLAAFHKSMTEMHDHMLDMGDSHEMAKSALDKAMTWKEDGADGVADEPEGSMGSTSQSTLTEGSVPEYPDDGSQYHAAAGAGKGNKVTKDGKPETELEKAIAAVTEPLMAKIESMGKQIAVLSGQPADNPATVFQTPTTKVANPATLGDGADLLNELLGEDRKLSAIDVVKLQQGDEETRRKVCGKAFGMLASSAHRGDMRFAKSLADPGFRGDTSAIEKRASAMPETRIKA